MEQMNQNGDIAPAAAAAAILASLHSSGAAAAAALEGKREGSLGVARDAA